MTARLFAAIWPDEAARLALNRDLDRIRESAGDVRWQSPDRWHITMAFLGPADPEKASVRLHKLLARHPPPVAQPLHLQGSGTFNTTIWAGVEHGAWLLTLAETFRSAHIDDHPFRAHLTVGRIRGQGAAARARQVAQQLAGIDCPAWTPREITLVASHGGPQPEYHILRRWPLPPPDS